LSGYKSRESAKISKTNLIYHYRTRSADYLEVTVFTTDSDNRVNTPPTSTGPRCYDLITQVATLGLRLEDELGVRGREYTID